MLLSVFERLLVLSVLPKEGDLTTIKIVRDLKAALSFTESEHKVLNFKVDPDTGGTRWEPGSEPVEIPIGPKAHNVIIEAFKGVDKVKKLSLEHLPVYERFLEAE